MANWAVGNPSFSRATAPQVAAQPKNRNVNTEMTLSASMGYLLSSGRILPERLAFN